MNQGLAIFKRTNLTQAQRALYLLVCNKIEQDDKLVFSEAKEIYLGYVNRHMIDGVPHKYDYWVPIYDEQGKREEGKWTCQLVPMTEEDIALTTFTWLTQNLGSLILKGYLTVMPAVDLRLVKEVNI